MPAVVLVLFTEQRKQPLLKKSSTLLIIALGLFFVGKYFWMKPKYDPGQSAPEFTVPGLYGDSISLSDYSGKYVLLDFWGSWCGPCRVESPELVQLYKDYHPKGLEILSIALDKSKSRWEGAVKKDGLIWEGHGSHLQRMKDPVASLYGVREIPTKYLIDAKGNIIATNPSFEELRSTLDDVLTK